MSHRNLPGDLLMAALINLADACGPPNGKPVLTNDIPMQLRGTVVVAPPVHLASATDAERLNLPDFYWAMACAPLPLGSSAHLVRLFSSRSS
ncbi:hypothetical protein GA0061098_105412 [Bradyrhizobium shewense]|uniref:Uncharacterized protein n=1 Tax=Bradyrhizobium shewense TaxID=1761772 RepID=A0A1C3XU52_9BRAD|nr:hypothetical protein GA0061098_105412 [Bradyrhizobium shewense]